MVCSPLSVRYDAIQMPAFIISIIISDLEHCKETLWKWWRPAYPLHTATHCVCCLQAGLSLLSAQRGGKSVRGLFCCISVFVEITWWRLVCFVHFWSPSVLFLSPHLLFHVKVFLSLWSEFVPVSYTCFLIILCMKPGSMILIHPKLESLTVPKGSKSDWFLIVSSDWNIAEFLTSFILHLFILLRSHPLWYGTALLPSVSTVALGMFCGAKYTGPSHIDTNH